MTASTAAGPTSADPAGTAPEEAARAGAPPGAVAGLGFTDRDGSHTVVLSVRRGDTEVALRAVLTAVDASGSTRVLRTVQDGVGPCPEQDVAGEFLPGSLAVHDDDGDGIGEVGFAYRTTCRTDVSPATLELLVLEGGDEGILRGQTSTSLSPFRTPVPELAPSAWPTGAYQRATDAFRQLAPEGG